MNLILPLVLLLRVTRNHPGRNMAFRSLVIALLLFAILPSRAKAVEISRLRVTYYHATGAPMANGAYPYPGAAACSRHFDLGTEIGLVGPDGWYRLTCTDRGQINAERWIDVFCPDSACDRYVRENLSPYAYGVAVER
jgi:hypothetical protein